MKEYLKAAGLEVSDPISIRFVRLAPKHYKVSNLHFISVNNGKRYVSG
jgi:hypothetical protein